MNWLIYGLIVSAYGLYRVISERREGKARDQLHAHKCWQCGTVWEHTGAQADADPEAHNCPKCGVLQFRTFHCAPKIKAPPPVGEQKSVARESALIASPAVPSAGLPADGSKPSGGTAK